MRRRNRRTERQEDRRYPTNWKTSRRVSCNSAEAVFQEYVAVRRDFWQMVGRPAANRASIDELQRETGLPRQTIVDARRNRRKLRNWTKRLNYAALRKVGYLRISIHDRRIYQP